MSIVLNVVTPTTSWIMSDGLAVNEDDPKRSSGSLKKFELIHPKLCVGFTGVYEVAVDLLSNLRRLCPGIESATVEQIASYSIAILREFPDSPTRNTQFLFTGISDSGDFSSVTLDGNLTADVLTPTKQSFRVTALYHTECSNFTENISSFIHAGLPLNQAVRKGMARTINQTALKDPTVNRTTFFQEIRR